MPTPNHIPSPQLEHLEPSLPSRGLALAACSRVTWMGNEGGLPGQHREMGGSHSRSKGEQLGELCPFSMQCSSHSSHEQLSVPAWAGTCSY